MSKSILSIYSELNNAIAEAVASGNLTCLGRDSVLKNYINFAPEGCTGKEVVISIDEYGNFLSAVNAVVSHTEKAKEIYRNASRDVACHEIQRKQDRINLLNKEIAELQKQL